MSQLGGREGAHSLYEKFHASEYGQSLDGKPRWERYRPSNVTPEEWIKLLGPDADNLQHMELTNKITNIFLHRDEGSLDLSDEEKEYLLVASIIHDWGESYDPELGRGGDINYELKTLSDAEKEQEVFHRVYDELIGSEDVKLRYILSGIVFDSTTKLGRIFNSIERTGYLHTALIAHQKSRTTDDDIKGNLEWLTAGVLSNQAIPLMEYAADYKPVWSYLQAVSPLIDEAFETIDENIFVRHGQTENDRRERYRQARTAWERGPLRSRDIVKPREQGIFSDNPNFDARFEEDYQKLLEKVEACRLLGLSVVLTSGSYDMLHVGHQRYLSRASRYGDVLVVGVDSDEKIKTRKGPNRPIISERERAEMVAHTRNVSLVTIKRQAAEKWELIKLLQPDVLVATAETYNSDEIRELEALYCKKVVVLEPQARTSTSARIRQTRMDQPE